jgi:hypothetical protein
MLNFQTQIPIDSKAVPGVKFVVRRLSVVERSTVDLSIIDAQVRAAELQDELKAIEAEYPTPKPKSVKEGEDPEPLLKRDIPPDVLKRETRLDFELGCIVSAHLKPAYIRAALVSLDGAQYAGRQATADMLLANGPDVLIDEVWLAANQHAKLSVEQQKNSPSPSTSAAPEGGQIRSSTAAIASDTPTT